jgi:hypothetical protein
MNFNFTSAEEYAAAICETVTAKNAMGKLEGEQRLQFVMDIKDEYEKSMGPHVLDPNSFEVMIITAIKT